jgi:predicted RNA-binding Zn-ribbon protein involved in translation (DUF1610 family)
MGVLILTCPETGQEVSTGIIIEEEGLRRLADTVTKAECPHCGQPHVWWTREGRLSDKIEPSQISMLRHAS